MIESTQATSSAPYPSCFRGSIIRLVQCSTISGFPGGSVRPCYSRTMHPPQTAHTESRHCTWLQPPHYRACL